MKLANTLLLTTPIVRGSWQSQDTNLKTYEMPNLIVQTNIPTRAVDAIGMCEPDMPWAEEHFRERVSGTPYNPPPSYLTWPWHSAKEADLHLGKEGFDHTYPERFWPKGSPDDSLGRPGMKGIRFRYGDLDDVVNQLKKDSWTRQAYLPVWFPEDTGAVGDHVRNDDERTGQRVPCTLGYHFIRNGSKVDINYFLRSCDITRHFHNDVYLAMRLLQWVLERCGYPNDFGTCSPGLLTVFISNMHLFEADAWRYQ